MPKPVRRPTAFQLEDTAQTVARVLRSPLAGHLQEQEPAALSASLAVLERFNDEPEPTGPATSPTHRQMSEAARVLARLAAQGERRHVTRDDLLQLFRAGSALMRLQSATPDARTTARVGRRARKLA